MDTATWDPKLRHIFGQLAMWLSKYGLIKTEKKQTVSFNLPTPWQAGNPFTSVEYMGTKGQPYVELRFYMDVVARLELQQEFSAVWEKITRIAEKSDSAVFIEKTRLGEHKVAFTVEGVGYVKPVAKLLLPIMNSARKKYLPDLSNE